MLNFRLKTAERVQYFLTTAKTPESDTSQGALFVVLTATAHRLNQSECFDV